MKIENDLDDSPQQDLWASLAGAMAEETETGESEVASAFRKRSPVVRRVGLGDKLVAQVLSGFLPVLFLAFVATILSVGSGDSLTVAVSLLFSMPLAWLLAPIFHIQRAGLGRFVGLGLLAAGASELGTLIPQTATTYFTLDREPTRWELIVALQTHLESFLTWSHWCIYGVSGILALYVVVTVARRFPWIDVAISGRARAITAWAVVLSPALLILWCGSVVFLKQRATAQWIEKYRGRETRFSYSYTEQTVWSQIYQPKVVREDNLSSPANVGLKKSKSVIQALEAKTSQTWNSPGHQVQRGADLYRIELVFEHLLENSDALAHPLETVDNYLEFMTEYRPPYISERVSKVFSNLLLPALAQGLSVRELPFWKSRIEELLSQCDHLEEDLNADMAETFQSYLMDEARQKSAIFVGEAPRPLKALGMELPASPLALSYYVEAERALRPWLEIKSQLDPQHPERLLLDWPAKEGTPFRKGSWYTARLGFERAVQRQWSPTLRPYLQTAQVLIAIRQFKVKTDSWPTTLEEISGDLTFHLDPAMFSYRVEGKNASLGALIPQSSDHHQLVWTLR